MVQGQLLLRRRKGVGAVRCVGGHQWIPLGGHLGKPHLCSVLDSSRHQPYPPLGVLAHSTPEGTAWNHPANVYDGGVTGNVKHHNNKEKKAASVNSTLRPLLKDDDLSLVGSTQRTVSTSSDASNNSLDSRQPNPLPPAVSASNRRSHSVTDLDICLAIEVEEEEMALLNTQSTPSTTSSTECYVPQRGLAAREDDDDLLGDVMTDLELCLEVEAGREEWARQAEDIGNSGLK